ncbi:N-acetylglucosamine repressor [Maioricimonas rarisocia]|uniref:N-acetylglucosamine repressor n=1 Tax=Maioricimonas rarisocia TaxID=2528026 RepID=A0A517ZB65_9PLAN|nr:ROK family transcriptional regulator [Maioricimonas rarisocia]QDU39745.1 N-acetylglucosamine repressor [Maioricimonas rarisocia]
MTAKIRPQLLRRMTVRRILELLQEQGPSTRAELTRLSGISAPTVSKAVASLLESGLLEEGEALPGSLGRPGKRLRLATEKAQVIGVVLDAGRCELVTASLDGTIDEEQIRRIPTPGSYQGLIDTLVAEAVEVSANNGITTLAMGVSVPGLTNRRRGTAVFSPNLHITDGRPLSHDLSERLGLECTIFQEAQALCLAERMYNGARALEDFVVLDISTGLGLGVFNNGRLLEGHSGLAGELGHVTMQPDGRLCGCGNRGCLETLATDTALAWLVSQRIGRQVDIEGAVDLIRRGEVQADAELRSVCEYLSIAIAAAINLFNPSSLFVHGRAFDARDGLFELVCEMTGRRALAPSLKDCTIIRARCSKRQGAVAAAIQSLTDAVGPTIA